MEYQLYLQGYEYEEIAKITKQSVNVVKAKCAAQRITLKKSLLW